MNETYLPSLKAKGTPCERSPGRSSEVPALFRGSLNAMPLRLIPGTIWLTKLRSARISASMHPMGDHDSRTMRSGGMSKSIFAGDGRRSLSREDFPLNILGSLSATRLSINGYTKKPRTSLFFWSEPIMRASTEGTPGNIKSPIFRRECLSKIVLKPFCCAATAAIGKQTRSPVVKATRRCR